MFLVSYYVFRSVCGRGRSYNRMVHLLEYLAPEHRACTAASTAVIPLLRKRWG